MAAFVLVSELVLLQLLEFVSEYMLPVLAPARALQAYPILLLAEVVLVELPHL